MGGGASKKADKSRQKGEPAGDVEDASDASPFNYEPLTLPDLYEEARRSKAGGKLTDSRDLADVLARHGTFCKLSEADAMMLRFCGSIFPAEGVTLDAFNDMLAVTPAVNARLKQGSPWSVWAQSLDLASIIGSAVQTALPALHPEQRSGEIVSLSEDDAAHILTLCKKALVQSLVQGAQACSVLRPQPPPETSKSVSLVSNLNVWSTSSHIRPIHEILGGAPGGNISLLESLQLELCNPELKRPSSAAKDGGTMSKGEWDRLVGKCELEVKGLGGDPASTQSVNGRVLAAGLEVGEWVALKVMLGVFGQQYDKYLGQAFRGGQRNESADEQDSVGLNFAMLAAASGLEKLRRAPGGFEGKIYLGLDGGVLPTALWPSSSGVGTEKLGLAASSFLVASVEKLAAVGAAKKRCRGGLPVVLEVTASGDSGAIHLDWLGSDAAGLVAISPLSTLVVSGEPRIELIDVEEEIIVLPLCVVNTLRNKTFDELRGDWRQSMVMDMIQELRGSAEADVRGSQWTSIVSGEFDRLKRDVDYEGREGLAEDRVYRRLLDTAIDIRIGCQEKTRALIALGSSLRDADNRLDVGSVIESILEEHADGPEDEMLLYSDSEDVAFRKNPPPAAAPYTSAFFLDLLLAVPAIEFSRQGFAEWLFSGFCNLPWEDLAVSEVCDLRWETRCDDVVRAWEMFQKAPRAAGEKMRRRVRVRAQDGNAVDWDVDIVEALLQRLRESDAETEDLRLNGPDVIALVAPILMKREALRIVHLSTDVPIADILTSDQLSLNNANMGLEESVLLASAIEISTSLSSLDLRQNAFTPAGETAIANALKHKQGLTSFNNLTLPEGEAEWNLITTTLSAVNGDGSTEEVLLGTMEKAFAASRVAINTQLEMLDGISFSDSQEKWASGGRSLQVYMLPFLANQLPRCQRLHTVNLSWSGIDADFIEWVGPSLSQMPSLTHLDMSKNNLGPAGCFKLALVSSRHGSAWKLSKLNLGSNNARDQGCASISAALPALPLLEHLNLSDNDVTGLGCMSLATFAHAAPKLQTIHIGAKGLDELDSGFRALRLAVPASCSLR